MTDLKRLMEHATPLPWYEDMLIGYDEGEYDDGHRDLSEADAALILHAVNRLPDYEAAVDALERLIRKAESEDYGRLGVELEGAHTALRRLR